MRNVHTQIKPGALTVLLFAQLGFAAHAAPPDAGQTMRELQQQPELTAPKEATPLRIEGEPAPKVQEIEDVRMVVKAIRVSGSSVFTAGELEALLADLTGGERSQYTLNGSQCSLLFALPILRAGWAPALCDSAQIVQGKFVLADLF